MQHDRKYRFVMSLPFLGLLLIFMYVTAWHLPADNYDRWIPIIAGFMNIGDIPVLQSHLLATFFLIITSFSLYTFNEKYIMAGRLSLFLPIIYLILALTSQKSLLFSGVSVATLLIIWAVYCSLNTKKEDQCIFISVFLAASAALFEPLALYLLPVVLFFSMRNIVVTFRTIVLASLALFIPFIFIFALRFLFFDDAVIFGQEYFDRLRFGNIFSPQIKSVSDIFFIITLFFLIIATIKDVMKRINSFKIIKSASFVRFISMIFLMSLTLLLYPDSGSWVMQVISIPAAVLIVESTGEIENSHNKRLGFLIVTIFMVVSRVSCFI